MSAITGPFSCRRVSVSSSRTKDHGRLTVTPTLAPAPVMNRPIIMSGAELPAGQSAFQRMYHALQAIHTLFLPYISDIAAMRKGANAIPRKYEESVICAVEAPILRSCAMSPNAAAIILALMIGMSWPKENIVPMMVLRCDGQLYGSAGSLLDDHVLCCFLSVLVAQLDSQPTPCSRCNCSRRS
jgi:hypothetical protein